MTPRSSEANQAIGEESRTRILAAALQVFVARGYEGTRMKDVADNAGLSYGLAYHYFRTKEAVFTALAERALGAAVRLIESLAKIPQDAAVKSAAIRTAIRYALVEPAPSYFGIILQTLTVEGIPSALRDRARASIRYCRDILTGVFTSAGKNAQAAAEAILTILLGAALLKLTGISDGLFAPPAASILALSTEQGGLQWNNMML